MNRMITASARYNTGNVVIIDCSDKSPAIAKAVNSFIKNYPRYPLPTVNFYCLHGEILDVSNGYCKYGNSTTVKGQKIQDIFNDHADFSIAVHIVSTKNFFLSPKFVDKLDIIKKMFIWTSPINFNGGAFDFRKRYWFLENVVEIRNIEDMGYYWANNERILKPFDKSTETTLSYISSCMVRFYEYSIPEIWT